MKNLHNKLCENVPVYKKWHAGPQATIINMCLFVIFSVIFAQTILGQISLVPSDSLTAASINSGRPEKFGRIVGEASDRILVKFKDGTSASRKDAIFAEKNFRLKSQISQIGVDIVIIDPNDTPSEAVQFLKFKHSKDIEYAEVDSLLEPARVPNDPSYPSQWDKVIMNVPVAWDSTVGSPTVIVGVADTGIDCTHEDLAANCVAGWNFYDNNSNSADVYGHGTAVAGVIAAVGNNALGIAGNAWNVKIMPLRISDTAGMAYMSTVASAITYAADRGVRVVNNSFGGSSASLDTAAKYLSSKTGGILVRSEGNSGADSGAPANPNIIMVSGTDNNDAMYSWSSFGADNDVAAPGCSTVTANGGGYRGFCGTSNSSPEVAGILALMYSANPSLNTQSASNALFSSALDLGTPGWDPYYGWGRIQADKAVLAAISQTTPPPAPSDTYAPSVPTNLSSNSLTSTSVNLAWSASTDNVGVSGYNLYRNGTKIWSGSTLGYNDNSLTVATTYSYTISSSDSAGNSSAQSAPVSVTTPSAPLAITSYGVTNKTKNSATLSWTTNLPSGGVVLYGTSSNSLTGQAPTTDATGTSHTLILSGLTNKTTYYYKIQATDGKTVVSTKVSSFKTAVR